MPTFFEELEFDLPKALIASLIELLDGMPQGELTEANVAMVGNEQGVYQLFLDGKLVYIGKTDAEAGLQARLRRHSKKILGRKNLSSARVTFKAVRVYVFTAMDLEELLIKKYDLNSNNSWNNSGFGSNDPGRERDTSTLKAHHFDKKFPMDYDYLIDVSANGEPQKISDVLKKLKDPETCPHLIRFQTAGGGGRAPHPDLENTDVVIPTGLEPIRQTLQRLKGALGTDWQITALPGYVIGYKERRDYKEGEILSPL